MTDSYASPQPAESTWWRWLVLLPACVLGSLLGAMAMGAFQWLGMKLVGGYSEDGWYFLYILPIITSGTMGYLWVRIAFEVAPKGKRISAIVMTVVLLAVLLLTIAYSNTNATYSTGEKMQSVLGGIAIAIAAMVAFAELKDSVRKSA